MTVYTRDWVKAQLIRRINFFKLLHIPRHKNKKDGHPPVKAQLGCHFGEEGWIDDIFEWLQHVLDMLERVDLRDRAHWEWRLADTLATIEEMRNPGQPTDANGNVVNPADVVNQVNVPEPVNVVADNWEEIWDRGAVRPIEIVDVIDQAIHNGAEPIGIYENNEHSEEADYEDYDYENEEYEDEYEEEYGQYDAYHEKGNSFVTNKEANREKSNKVEGEKTMDKRGKDKGSVSTNKKDKKSNDNGGDVDNAVEEFAEDFGRNVDAITDSVMRQVNPETTESEMGNVLQGASKQLEEVILNEEQRLRQSIVNAAVNTEYPEKKNQPFDINELRKQREEEDAEYGEDHREGIVV